MKHVILCLLAILVVHVSAFSQDTLVSKNGDEIVVKVLKISDTEIEYKRFDNLDGPLIVVLKSAVKAIRYPNGTKDVFEEPIPVAVPTPSSTYYVAPITNSRLTSQELYNKGRQDALIYYKGRGAFWGTFGPSAYFPPAGLVTGLIVGLKTPKPKRYVMSEDAFRQEPNYLKGYQEQAHRRKIGKVAEGFGAGTGVFLITYLLVYALAGN